jgi:DNA polymerase elongation subunit (family B)
VKILALDIETTPNLAHVWGLWQQNVAISQIDTPTEMLCFVAKWVGEPKIEFHPGQFHPEGDSMEMIYAAHSLLDAADAVLHYNGKRFDIPHLNREFLLAGLLPPSPYRQIDLLETVKRQFRFPSNKLDYVTKALGYPGKVKVDFELWLDCMAGRPDAWKKMEKYNRRDVTEMEKLYETLKPWIIGHPNAGIDEAGLVCPTCGSDDLQRRGFAHTPTGKFQQHQCKSCGRYSRSKKRCDSAELQPVAV